MVVLLLVVAVVVVVLGAKTFLLYFASICSFSALSTQLTACTSCCWREEVYIIIGIIIITVELFICVVCTFQIYFTHSLSQSGAANPSTVHESSNLYSSKEKCSVALCFGSLIRLLSPPEPAVLSPSHLVAHCIAII